MWEDVWSCAAASWAWHILLSDQTNGDIQYHQNSRYVWCVTLVRDLHNFPAGLKALKKQSFRSMGVLKEYFCFNITQTESQHRDSLTNDHPR